jgi:hypothetical protein
MRKREAGKRSLSNQSGRADSRDESVSRAAGIPLADVQRVRGLIPTSPLMCWGCGKEFARAPDAAYGGVRSHFCSRRCQAVAVLRARSGVA